MKFPHFKAALLCFLTVAFQDFSELLAGGSDSDCVFDSDLELAGDGDVDVDLGFVLVVGFAVTVLRRNLRCLHRRLHEHLARYLGRR